MDKVIIKCFRTPDYYYVYDRYSNALISLSDDEYNELKRVEEHTLPAEESRVIRSLQKEEVCLPNHVEKIEHPETLFLPHVLENRVTDIILQVTQNCNLRCGYCIYGGNYINRSHTPKKMTFDMAKRAIDFGIAHSYESKTFTLSFYGGEPLLEFNLIKECVSYVKDSVRGKPVAFTMTTNGTLLNDEIMEFLKDNKFLLLISLDGDKNSHDANRKFSSGKGSFDIIMANVEKFYSLYPQYINEYVQFNTVINPMTNPSCFEEFFAVKDIFQDTRVMFNDVSMNNLKDAEHTYASYSEKYRVKRKFEYLKLLAFLIGKLDIQYVSKLVLPTKRTYYELYKQLQIHEKIPAILHHAGPCVPGKTRLFVNVDGELYPCEKVPELHNMCIGNLKDGFDQSKVNQIMNIGKLTEKECMNCWALRLCSSCINDIECNEECELCRENKLKTCKERKINAMLDLYYMSILCEKGFKLPVEEM